MIKKYIEYYKDNPQGLWFKRKLFGWGWTPVKWQGWLTLGIYVLVMVWLFTKTDANSHSGSDTLIAFAGPFIVATSILIIICYKKGEKPKWQWGIPTKS